MLGALCFLLSQNWSARSEGWWEAKCAGQAQRAEEEGGQGGAVWTAGSSKHEATGEYLEFYVSRQISKCRIPIFQLFHFLALCSKHYASSLKNRKAYLFKCFNVTGLERWAGSHSSEMGGSVHGRLPCLCIYLSWKRLGIFKRQIWWKKGANIKNIFVGRRS